MGRRSIVMPLDGPAECTHTDGPFHNCEYVESRNALIPRAVDVTNQRIGLGSGSWSFEFMQTMGELALEAGIVQTLKRPEPKPPQRWEEEI